MGRNKVPHCIDCDSHCEEGKNRKIHCCRALNKRLSGREFKTSPLECPKRDKTKRHVQQSDKAAPEGQIKIEPRTLRIIRAQNKINAIQLKYGIDPEDLRELKINFLVKIFG